MILLGVYSGLKLAEKEVKKPVEEHKSPEQPAVVSSKDTAMHNEERACAYCGTGVAVGDTHCHKCGVEYEQE